MSKTMAVGRRGRFMGVSLCRRWRMPRGQTGNGLRRRAEEIFAVFRSGAGKLEHCAERPQSVSVFRRALLVAPDLVYRQRRGGVGRLKGGRSGFGKRRRDSRRQLTARARRLSGVICNQALSGQRRAQGHAKEIIRDTSGPRLIICLSPQQLSLEFLALFAKFICGRPPPAKGLRMPRYA